jgi:hypothetical protein
VNLPFGHSPNRWDFAAFVRTCGGVVKVSSLAFALLLVSTPVLMSGSAYADGCSGSILRPSISRPRLRYPLPHRPRLLAAALMSAAAATANPRMLRRSIDQSRPRHLFYTCRCLRHADGRSDSDPAAPTNRCLSVNYACKSLAILHADPATSPSRTVSGHDQRGTGPNPTISHGPAAPL